MTSNFFDFSSFILSSSFGPREKKATSEPDTNAEKSNRISKTTIETIRGIISVLKFDNDKNSKIKIKMVNHLHRVLKAGRQINCQVRDFQLMEGIEQV